MVAWRLEAAAMAAGFGGGKPIHIIYKLLLSKFHLSIELGACVKWSIES
jgi:hypothetical protein